MERGEVEGTETAEAQQRKSKSKGGKTVHVVIDHSSNVNVWIIPLKVAMKDVPGVSHIL